MLAAAHTPSFKARTLPHYAHAAKLRSVRVLAQSAAAAAPIHIVGISGSLRKASTNTGLLRAAAKSLPPGVSFEIVPLSGMPAYDDDLWQGGADEARLPEPVRRLRAAVSKADALLFACPEYNSGLTSGLKAAIDWGCCGKGANVFDGKAAAIVGAGGGAGTARAQTMLRMVGVYPNIIFINGPEVALKRFEMPGSFDDATGDLTDANVEGWVKAKVEALVAFARVLKT